MYVKYKLREASEAYGVVSPKGPNFARAPTVRCDFDGTVLSFKAPKHRPRNNRVSEFRPERRYDLDTIERYF